MTETPTALPGSPPQTWRPWVCLRAATYCCTPRVQRSRCQRCRSAVSPQGTVVVPHGVPGMNVNALMPSGVTHLEPLSGQHHMTGIAVQVTLAPQGCT